MFEAKLSKDGKTLDICGIDWNGAGKVSGSGKSMLKASTTQKVSINDKVHTIQLNVFEAIKR